MDWFFAFALGFFCGGIVATYCYRRLVERATTDLETFIRNHENPASNVVTDGKTVRPWRGKV